ncbi:MAG TPA: ferric reductase-like transmembrane domain-containing protein [Dehalococcoidia bacterium]|nr:ferric reductase-like transmembrane domain-containing protein [Dehalococcoidia bacterium]
MLIRRRSLPLLACVAVLPALMPLRAFAATTAESPAANVPWYLSRATGFVAYLLLFVTVSLGLAIRTKALDRLVARWRVTDLHGFLSVLAGLFMAVHVAALLGDTFIGFSVVQLLMPFASPYEAVWTGTGQIVAYLLIAILISFPARRLIGYRAWRALHYLTLVAYLGALAHGVFTGTDSPQRWAQAVYLGTAGCVAALLLYRIVAWNRRALSQHAARLRTLPGVLLPAQEAGAERTALHLRALLFGVATVGALGLLFLGAGVGPFHWLRGGGAADGEPAQAGVAVARVNPVGFHDSFSGTVSANRRRTTLAVQLSGSGDRAVSLAMQVQPSIGDDGSLRYTGAATLSDAGGVTLCSGQVTALDPNGFTIDCQGAGEYAGKTLRLQGDFTASDGQQLWGSLDATVVSGAT